ncbi:MAG: GntR family transcriptional regulator [Austwickia sp.]|jgi:GntR family transcriptional regulator|nr:GntR family transcriptional regulator [Austwickia sp.]MBK8436618.1 GntR family transcriptional regulator [Austwickia sp.]MBK9102283.1 GntR family transcriptional regulator [Austwickia sp.]
MANVTQQSRTRRRRKYEVVESALERRIAGLLPHDTLPPERDLMREFEVSRMTIRQAVSRLVARGLVYNVQGSGTFVSPVEVITKTLTLTGFSEDMRQRGLTPSSRVLAVDHVAASPETAARLGYDDPATCPPVVRLRRLRCADGAPMAVETVEVLATVADWSAVDPSGSLYEQLEGQGLQIVRAAQVIAAVNLGVEEAKILDQAVGAAAIRVSRVSYTGRGQAVEVGHTLYRADRYDFDIVVTREPR